MWISSHPLIARFTSRAKWTQWHYSFQRSEHSHSIRNIISKDIYWSYAKLSPPSFGMWFSSESWPTPLYQEFFHFWNLRNLCLYCLYYLWLVTCFMEFFAYLMGQSPFIFSIGSSSPVFCTQWSLGHFVVPSFFWNWVFFPVFSVGHVFVLCARFSGFRRL